MCSISAHCSQCFSKLPIISRQEGDLYKRIEVSVALMSGEQFTCHTFVVKDDLGTSLPSPAYLNVIIAGAVEHGLPEDYVEGLRKQPHNGYNGVVNPP